MHATKKQDRVRLKDRVKVKVRVKVRVKVWVKVTVTFHFTRFLPGFYQVTPTIQGYAYLLFYQISPRFLAG